MHKTKPSWILLALLGFIVLGALLAPFLPLLDPNRQDLANTFARPLLFGGSLEHPLGTDSLGRDMLSRLAYGARFSILIALCGAVLSGIFGTALGIAVGLVGGWFDAVVSRLTEAQLALPFMLLAAALIVSQGQSLTNLVLVLALYGWAPFTRVVRAEVMSLRSRPWVLGLRVAGMSQTRIMVRHLLPSVVGSVVVIGTLQVGFMILGESALSFIGLGVVAPDVSWGLMLAEGRSYMTHAWWMATLPGLAIALFVILVNLSGDALRQQFDPRRKVSIRVQTPSS